MHPVEHTAEHACITLVDWLEGAVRESAIRKCFISLQAAASESRCCILLPPREIAASSDVILTPHVQYQPQLSTLKQNSYLPNPNAIAIPRRHTSRFLVIYVTFMPFTLWSACGWGAVPASVIIAFLLLGIEEIGVQIEEPFGILPLGAVGQTLSIREGPDRLCGVLSMMRVSPPLNYDRSLRIESQNAVLSTLQHVGLLEKDASRSVGSGIGIVGVFTAVLLSLRREDLRHDRGERHLSGRGPLRDELHGRRAGGQVRQPHPVRSRWRTETCFAPISLACSTLIWACPHAAAVCSGMTQVLSRIRMWSRGSGIATVHTSVLGFVANRMIKRC